MKYIIMCSGNYLGWADLPKQMQLIGNERIVERTIRLLRENGVEDIAISSNLRIFKQYESIGVQFMEVAKTHTLDKPYGKGYLSGHWLYGFVDTGGEVCYIFGDVVFSRQAIKTIVETQTTDVEFFASAPPFHKDYPVPWAEPFAFKVVDREHFRQSINKALNFNGWHREPVSWELWQVIKDTPYNHIDYTNYTAINDYTCDVDTPQELADHYDRIIQCIEADK